MQDIASFGDDWLQDIINSIDFKNYKFVSSNDKVEDDFEDFLQVFLREVSRYEEEPKVPILQKNHPGASSSIIFPSNPSIYSKSSSKKSLGRRQSSGSSRFLIRSSGPIYSKRTPKLLTSVAIQTST
ncbi:unnamed protein product [Lepeophtheirus salmonis]|uniref:(salmon louse) hypothetical protein n=1 Tax=Lepeophtheirus salmonis TaxID=72036 RepID=A0A0K2VBB0_LEPSM|nr:unnamed protein product [Lepeophtheirus salmonis]CAF2752150.1 unnamed protein product [Lepeophtheirus salmonis]